MATGDILSLTVVDAVPDAQGHAIPFRGAAVAIVIEGMGARHPINDPFFDPSTLVINITRPGFTAAGATTTVSDVVNGTIAIRNAWPDDWNTLGSSVPPRSWCSGGSNGNRMYYTEAGGTKGATRPTGTTNLGTVSDGGVTWIDYDPTLIANGTTQNAGYVNNVASGNVTVYAALDFPIYQADTINSASIGAGAYKSTINSAGATITEVSSNGKASITCTNSSTLQYGFPVVKPITMPHLASQGTFDFEIHVGSPWFRNNRQVACMKAQAFAWDGLSSGAQQTITTTVLSNVAPLSAPANVALEVMRAPVPTTAIAAGDSYIEYEVYPFVGDKAFKSKSHGEGRNWQPSTAYSGLREVVRNGTGLYYLATAGTSAASGGPTGTGTAISDGTAVWNYFGSAVITAQLGNKQFSSNPQARHHFLNDKGTYRRGWCYVNDTGTNIGAPTPYPDYATALANKAVGSYGTAALAAAGLRTYHNTAGGGLTTHDDAGGGTMLALAGTHSAFGATMATLAVGSEWLTFKVDPTASAGSVIFGYINSTARSAFRRMKVEGFSCSGGSGSLISSNEPVTTIGPPNVELWMEGITYAGTSSADTIQVNSGISWFRNGTVTGGVALQSENSRSHVVDALGSRLGGTCVLRMSDMLAFRVPPGGATTFADIGRTYLPGRMFMNNGRWMYSGTPTGNTPMAPLLNNNAIMPYLGTVFETCITEALSLSNSPALRIGADGSDVDLNNVSVQYINVVGERFNIGYNDSPAGGPATPIRENWFMSNNVTQSRSSVTDYTAHPISTSPRGLGRFNNYPVVYAVGFRDSVTLTGNGSSGTNPATAMQRFGIRDSWGQRLSDAAQVGEYVNNKSRDAGSGNNTGDGDYHPATGALALNKAVVTGWKYDLLGKERAQISGLGASGALEGPVNYAVAPVTARMGLIAASPTITASGASISVAPDDVLLLTNAGSPTLSFTVANFLIAPAAAKLSLIAASPTITYTAAGFGVAPAAATLNLAAASPTIGFTQAAYSVAPAAAKLALSATSPTIGYTQASYTVTPASAALPMTATAAVVSFSPAGFVTPEAATLLLVSTSPTLSAVVPTFTVAPASAALAVAATSPTVTYTQASYTVAPADATLRAIASGPSIGFVPLVILNPATAIVGLKSTSPALDFDAFNTYSPVSLNEAKAWLRVESDDDDLLIGSLIDSAAAYIERTTGIVCKPQTYTFEFDGFGTRLELLRTPIRSITSIDYADDAGGPQSLAVSDWREVTRNGVVTLQPGFGAAWPYAYAGSVAVVAQVGYASNFDVPGDVKLAALEYVAQHYQNREAGAANLAGVDKLLSTYRMVVA